MKFIIKFRHIIFGIFTVLFIAGLLLVAKVNINYDGASYLPDNSNTKEALVVMNEEFGVFGACEIMVEDVSQLEALSIYQDINAIGGVKQVEFYPNQPDYYKNNNALFKVVFTTETYDLTTTETLDEIRLVLNDHNVYMRGETINAIQYNNVIQDEIVKIILILVPIVLIILFLTTTSWIEPVLFIIVVLFAVLINMGSNAFLPEVSYMTHATCGILQLALCMDYTVMMLHSYKEERLVNPSAKESVKIAARKSFVPILSSMLTTVAGFVALLFMTYTIGFDIGIVLIKGTLLSFAATFLLMPGLIVMFSSLIEKTKHRSILRPVKATYSFLYKTRYIMPVIAALIIGVSFFIQQENTFDYSETQIVYETPTLGAGYKAIRDEFGLNNNMVVLVPKNIPLQGAYMAELGPLLVEVQAKSVVSPLIFHTPYSKSEFTGLLSTFGLDAESITSLGDVFDLMMSVEGGTEFSIVEMVTFIEETTFLPPESKAALAPFIYQMNATRSELEGVNFDRFIIITNIEAESPEAFSFVDNVDRITGNHFDEYYLLGESVGIRDIKNVIADDYWKVTIITAVLVFTIILISFKNFLIPAILLLLILGATWINMSIPVMMGTNLLYLGYIIVSGIMLGATIDYAILYTHKYREKRQTLSKIESMQEAFNEAKHTVLTSGLILTFAGFALALFSSIPSISVFGSLIGRGAIASVVLVLFVLPQALFISDKLIIPKKTISE